MHTPTEQNCLIASQTWEMDFFVPFPSLPLVQAPAPFKLLIWRLIFFCVVMFSSWTTDPKSQRIIFFRKAVFFSQTAPPGSFPQFWQKKHHLLRLYLCFPFLRQWGSMLNTNLDRFFKTHLEVFTFYCVLANVTFSSCSSFGYVGSTQSSMVICCVWISRIIKHSIRQYVATKCQREPHNCSAMQFFLPPATLVCWPHCRVPNDGCLFFWPPPPFAKGVTPFMLGRWEVQVKIKFFFVVTGRGDGNTHPKMATQFHKHTEPGLPHRKFVTLTSTTPGDKFLKFTNLWAFSSVACIYVTEWNKCWVQKWFSQTILKQFNRAIRTRQAPGCNPGFHFLQVSL